MTRSRLLLMTLVALLTTAFVVTAVAAPQVVAHQGRLLDSDDKPISGMRTLIYTIWDAAVDGNLLWTENHAGVVIVDGLFTVELGATVPLTADIVAGGGGGGGGGILRYLQIQVAGEAPISPRTPLTAVPYSVVTGSVVGDIQTAPGHVTIGGSVGAKMSVTTTGDSASIDIDESGARRVSISTLDGPGGGSGGSMISLTGDPDFDLLRLTATQDSAKIRISGQSSGDPDFDLLRIVAGKGNGDGGLISITGDPDFDLLRLAADQDSAKIRISGQSSGDPDFDLLRIVGGSSQGSAGASMTLTGDPDFDLLRITASPDSAKIRLGGKITGDPDFDLLRLAGGSGASQLLMQSEPSGVDAISQSLDAACDNDNARLAIKTKGTSAQREIKASTDSDSASVLITIDDDADGIANAGRLVLVSGSFGAGSAAVVDRLQCDTDDDGDADLNAETIVDSDSACFRLNGLPPGTPVIGSSISMVALPTGAHMAVGSATCDGTNWVNASDRESKENFQPVDPQTLLAGISQLPISQWSYKNDATGATHIGPTAQDFYRLFGLGSSDKTISTIDPSGVALAAIQELSKQLKTKDQQLADLKAEIEALRQLILDQRK